VPLEESDERLVDYGVLIRTSHYIEHCCDKGRKNVNHYNTKVTLHSHRGGKVDENCDTIREGDGNIDEWLEDELLRLRISGQ
jgi:hypothetical protein